MPYPEWGAHLDGLRGGRGGGRQRLGRSRRLALHPAERVRDVVNRRLAKALEELIRAGLDEPAHTNTPKRMREW